MAQATTTGSEIGDTVDDGDSFSLTGFTHLIPLAAGHKIIRADREDLEVIRATPDLLYDQLIAAGCASKVTFTASTLTKSRNRITRVSGPAFSPLPQVRQGTSVRLVDRRVPITSGRGWS